MSTYILGISALYHDSAAALLRDGTVVAAAQEERFTRRKHDPRFPEKAIEYCLAEVGIGPQDLHSAVFYEKPLVKFDRLLETYLEVGSLRVRDLPPRRPAVGEAEAQASRPDPEQPGTQVQG